MSSSPESVSLCVVVVEDDEGVRRSLELLLRWRGFAVLPCDSLAAVRALDASAVGLLITDYHLSDGTGFDVLDTLHATGWRGRAVLMSAEVSPDLVKRALALGFHAVLEKPMERDALIRALTE